MLSNNLNMSIEAAGYRMKTFKVEHLEEISTGFEELAAKGLLDRDFYDRDLTGFQYDCKGVLENAKSVIVVASPQYKSIAEFKHGGGTVQALIPPTYAYPGINAKVADILEDMLVKNGYAWAKPVLPLKLLTVRSGLGAYGRNNICYVQGFGSFVRLNAYITDYEFEEDSWGDAKAMESCSTCSLCIDSCPTRAIDKERFLIHAHKCMTNFNEYEAPIPEWIRPEWHNSIVGCMKCQTVCPQNKKFIDSIEEKICFDEKETEMILVADSFGGLTLETRSKLSHAGLESYYGVLPRNIRFLIKN